MPYDDVKDRRISRLSLLSTAAQARQGAQPTAEDLIVYAQKLERWVIYGEDPVLSGPPPAAEKPPEAAPPQAPPATPPPAAAPPAEPPAAPAVASEAQVRMFYAKLAAKGYKTKAEKETKFREIMGCAPEDCPASSVNAAVKRIEALGRK